MRGLVMLMLFMGSNFNLVYASLTLDKVLGEMQAKDRTVRNIMFGFEQQVRFSEVSESTTVQGEAVFSKPGKIRIHKKFPDEQITVSNGQKIWIYTPSFNQVWEGSVNNWIGASLLPRGIIPLDNFTEDLMKNFNLRLSERASPDEELWLLATPKDGELDYKLELQISTTSWLPVKTIYRSESAEIITALSAAQVNSEVSNTMFQFDPPKDAEVIPLN